jgi:hypothetical protein
LEFSTIHLLDSKIPIKIHLVTCEEANTISKFLKSQGKTKYEGISSISSRHRRNGDLEVNSIVSVVIKDIDLLTQTITAKHLFQIEIKKN